MLLLRMREVMKLETELPDERGPAVEGDAVPIEQVFFGSRLRVTFAKYAHRDVRAGAPSRFSSWIACAVRHPGKLITAQTKPLSTTGGF